MHENDNFVSHKLKVDGNNIVGDFTHDAIDNITSGKGDRNVIISDDQMANMGEALIQAGFVTTVKDRLELLKEKLDKCFKYSDGGNIEVGYQPYEEHHKIENEIVQSIIAVMSEYQSGRDISDLVGRVIKTKAEREAEKSVEL